MQNTCITRHKTTQLLSFVPGNGTATKGNAFMMGKNDAVNESLSALLDNEHSELDLRRVLKAAESNEFVAEKWSSYQLTRQIIKKQLDVKAEPSFLAGIQDAIAYDDIHTAEPSDKAGRSSLSVWQRYTGKLAVAACFTFVFLIGANQWSRNADTIDSAPQELAAEEPAATVPHESVAVVPEGFALPPLTARTVSSDPSLSSSQPSYAMPLRSQSADQSRLQEVVLNAEQQALLQRLMLKHADSSAANGGLGVMPYTRVDAVESSE